MLEAISSLKKERKTKKRDSFVVVSTVDCSKLTSPVSRLKSMYPDGVCSPYEPRVRPILIELGQILRCTVVSTGTCADHSTVIRIVSQDCV